MSEDFVNLIGRPGCRVGVEEYSMFTQPGYLPLGASKQ